MQTKIKVRASAEELYKTLITSVIMETKQACGKELTEEEINDGYKYRHKISQGKKIIDTTVHIRKPIENKNVHLSISYPDRVIEMDYLLEEADSNQTLLTYTQIDNKANKETFFENFFFQKSIKSRIKKIERYILSQRT